MSYGHDVAQEISFFLSRRPKFNPRIYFAICGDINSTRTGFLVVLSFILWVLIPHTAPHSSVISQGCYNRPNISWGIKCIQSHFILWTKETISDIYTHSSQNTTDVVTHYETSHSIFQSFQILMTIRWLVISSCFFLCVVCVCVFVCVVCVYVVLLLFHVVFVHLYVFVCSFVWVCVCCVCLCDFTYLFHGNTGIVAEIKTEQFVLAVTFHIFIPERAGSNLGRDTCYPD